MQKRIRKTRDAQIRQRGDPAETGVLAEVASIPSTFEPPSDATPPLHPGAQQIGNDRPGLVPSANSSGVLDPLKMATAKRGVRTPA